MGTGRWLVCCAGFWQHLWEAPPRGARWCGTLLCARSVRFEVDTLVCRIDKSPLTGVIRRLEHPHTVDTCALEIYNINIIILITAEQKVCLNVYPCWTVDLYKFINTAKLLHFWPFLVSNSECLKLLFKVSSHSNWQGITKSFDFLVDLMLFWLNINIQSVHLATFLPGLLCAFMKILITVSTVQYSTVQYSTVQYSTVQYSTRVILCEIKQLWNIPITVSSPVILCESNNYWFPWES